MDVMRILVLTETDSCCGPMAAAFLNDYATWIEAVSAGSNPSLSLAPSVVAVMKECLVDLTGYVPRSIDGVDVGRFDRVYACPDKPGPPRLDDCRKLRDFVKNEAFLFFRALSGGGQPGH